MNLIFHSVWVLIFEMGKHDNIDYIAARYRDGLFKVKPALERITSKKSSWWSPFRIAAASAAVVVLSATAAVVVHYHNISEAEPVESIVQPSPVMAIKIIDFENTPLPTVVEKIKEVYGVEVTGIPENPENYVLSLHYEGTASDLLDTINDILDTEMEIEK